MTPAETSAAWLTTPYFMRLDRRYGPTVRATKLKGGYYRRALVILAEAERHGGMESEGFRAWLARAATTSWGDADVIILRALANATRDPDRNT